MIFAEVLALLALLTGGGLSAGFLWRWLQAPSESTMNHRRMHDELKKALESRDHRKLDDLMVIWGDELGPKLLSRIQQRRDEFYIEEDVGRKT